MNEERAFLKAILERPDDDVTKQVYADWLEEQGDPRGDYLRLLLQLRQQRVITPEQQRKHTKLSAELAAIHTQLRREWEDALAGHARPENQERQRLMQELESQLASLSKRLRQQIPARLQELAATFDTNWLAVVSDPEVEGCGKSGGSGWQPRFDFVCDKSWADMKPTDSNNVRHCETCSQNVHFCDNLADAREHSQEGHCIAVDLGIIRREGDLVPRGMFLGRPSREDVRRTYEDDVDPVSRARLATRRQGKKKRTGKEAEN
jgi:uncharacterized protein (TIGR02996 family)